MGCLTTDAHRPKSKVLRCAEGKFISVGVREQPADRCRYSWPVWSAPVLNAVGHEWRPCCANQSRHPNIGLVVRWGACIHPRAEFGSWLCLLVRKLMAELARTECRRCRLCRVTSLDIGGLREAMRCGTKRARCKCGFWSWCITIFWRPCNV